VRGLPENVITWVVYKQPDGTQALCEQSEWDALERARPGYFTLIRAGIGNEGEAERLARGTSGDPPVRGARKSTNFPPGK
jgi:hypothetical protein